MLRVRASVDLHRTDSLKTEYKEKNRKVVGGAGWVEKE
jgi:hypothetical protein